MFRAVRRAPGAYASPLAANSPFNKQCRLWSTRGAARGARRRGGEPGSRRRGGRDGGSGAPRGNVEPPGGGKTGRAGPAAAGGAGRGSRAQRPGRQPRPSRASPAPGAEQGGAYSAAPAPRPPATLRCRTSWPTFNGRSGSSHRATSGCRTSLNGRTGGSGPFARPCAAAGPCLFPPRGARRQERRRGAFC